jgi:hypothetical protein
MDPARPACFCGARRGKQGCIIDSAWFHGQGTGLEMGYDRLNDLLAEVVLLQQVPKGQNRRLIWDPLNDQVHSGDAPQRRHPDKEVIHR